MCSCYNGDDTMAATHIFFTSYARLDNTDGKLGQAVEKLKSRVIAKVGENTTIFFDTSDLRNGKDWEDALGNALKEIRVAVCLCSPSYLKSAFCAKEFEIFRKRVDADAKNTGAIIPVVWEPVALPEAIKRFHQPKDPRFPSDYYVAGLYKLSTLPSQIENFLKAIEVLADDIDTADRSQLAPYAGPIVYDELPDFFHNPQPERYGVRLTVLNDKRSQWKPGNVRSNIGMLMDQVTDSLRVAWEDVPPDLKALLEQLEDAEKDRLIWVFAVDRDDMTKAPWQQMLMALNEAGRSNTAIVVGWQKSELEAPADVQAALQKLIPSGITRDCFALDDEAPFKETVKKTIATVRMALIAGDDAKRVVAPKLRDEAVRDGIPIDSIPTLPSPGAAA